jgi:hypothetical protein
MKRELAIKKVLELINRDALIKTTAELAKEKPNNFPLQLLNNCFTGKDLTDNWFTALSVMAVHQGMFTLQLLQKAHAMGGYPPMNYAVKASLLDTIAQNGKLTKADAG